MDYKKGIITASLTFALAGTGCKENTPINTGCPITVLRKMNQIISKIDDQTLSEYDKNDKDIPFGVIRKNNRSSVLISSNIVFEDDVEGKIVKMNASWKVAGTALINPETKEEYVLTLRGIINPLTTALKRKKISKLEMEVGGFPISPKIPARLGGPALLHVLGCPERRGCFDSYTGKISDELGAGDFVSGFGYDSEKSGNSFYGNVEGLENLIGLIPVRSVISVYSGNWNLGAGVFVYKKGIPYLAGPIVNGNGDIAYVSSSSVLKNLLEEEGLGKFYFPEKTKSER
ncbi:MAG: hypothetical protein KKA62_01090 [Nanoarchaeota archaeon]|nr:hypothetical protein [Nanoarchaeota archaeon]MBU1643558.1 hypothetical protein [Nanoarchaeota archaeon]MBU1976530.1 hypothetical protein [Nanoarchaeota archaeon]